MRDWPGLTRLADAVADGIAVDWNRLPDDSSPEDRAVVEQLRVLAAISTVHRTAEPRDMLETEFPAARPAVQADRQWGPLLILGELGAGSQGRVYRALDPRLQREVALKVVRHAGGDAVSAMHLVAEARLLARVRHPNIVTVYGADRIADEVGLWMELVEGRTLASRVATDGPYSAEEAALIGATLCRALAAVHQAGLLHRDIKAQNVMREAGGRVVLMDFGAGRDLQEASHVRRTMGTPVYLAPEVLAGEPASVQSDIYSLGVLLFFLTTKRFPVIGTNLGELRERHQRGQISLLRDLRPDLPEPFVAVVARALAADPRQRFESAGRLEEALTRFNAASVAPTVAPPTAWSAAERSPRVVGRRGVIAAAVAVSVAVAVTGAWLWPRATTPTEKPSIAVLPLRNLSGDSAKEYLADSLTDVLITHLTKIDGVRVLSFPAVAPLKGQPKTPNEAGVTLGVRYLLAGAIALQGTAIRTTVQLIDAESGTTLWAEEYMREPSRLLEQQGEIVRTVVARLRVDLSDELSERLRTRRAASVEAQDSFLRGLADAARNPANVQPAIEHLERAIATDPSFAEAWAALALTRITFANQVPGPDRDGQYARARQEAIEAVERDPALGKAYAALGTIRFYYDWDWRGAEEAFKRSIELTPGDALAHQRYSTFLSAAGRTSEAIQVGEVVQSMEPVFAIPTASLGNLHYYARQYTEAIREMERALQLSPGLPVAQFGLCRIYAALGRFDEAIGHCQSTIAGGNRLNGLLELARVYALAQRGADARRTLDEVQSLPQSQWINPDNFAFVHAALGDRDSAFRLLEEARRRRAPNLLWIRVDPRFDPLREDPRFAPLVEQVTNGPG